MTYNSQNIFAQILRNEIPSNKVYEDQWSLAFYDANPATPVHVLVIPKGKYISWADFNDNASADEIVGFSRAIAKVAKQLNIENSGYRIISNHGADSNQEVPHLHVHILAGCNLGSILPLQRSI